MLIQRSIWEYIHRHIFWGYSCMDINKKIHSPMNNSRSYSQVNLRSNPKVNTRESPVSIGEYHHQTNMWAIVLDIDPNTAHETRDITEGHPRGDRTSPGLQGGTSCHLQMHEIWKKCPGRDIEVGRGEPSWFAILCRYERLIWARIAVRRMFGP